MTLSTQLPGSSNTLHTTQDTSLLPQDVFFQTENKPAASQNPSAYQNITPLDPASYLGSFQFQEQQPDSFFSDSSDFNANQLGLDNDIVGASQFIPLSVGSQAGPTLSNQNQNQNQNQLALLHTTVSRTFTPIQKTEALPWFRSPSTPSDWQMRDDIAISWDRQMFGQLPSDSSWVITSGDSDSIGFRLTPDTIGSSASRAAAEIAENPHFNHAAAGYAGMPLAKPAQTVTTLSNSRPDKKSQAKELQIVQYGEEEPTRKRKNQGVDLLSNEVGPGKKSLCVRVKLIPYFVGAKRGHPVRQQWAGTRH